MHSSGDRDPDSEGTSGISGSKMRQHASTGNKEAFHAGAPSKMKPEHKDAMYNDLRKSQGLKENIEETLRPEMGAGAYVNDFINSTNPKFNNKSKEERRRMAIGAFMAAKARGVKEEIQIDELSTDLLGRYKTAAGADAKAADTAGNYAKGDKRFKGINKATNKQFDNDLKKHGQMKEDNSHYDEAEEHLSKANDADAKGDKKTFHAHMADHHDALSMWHDSKGRSASADKHSKKAEFHHEKSLTEGTLQGNIGGGDAMNTTTSAPSASTVKDTTMNKKIKGFKFFNGENDRQMNMNQPVKEEKKDDVPFDGPYTSSFKKPHNPNRTGMDAARSLAQRAMDQLSKKKKEEIKENEKPHPVELDMIGKTREMGVQNRARDAEQRMAKRAAEPKNIIQKVKKDIGGPLSKLAKGNLKGALGEDFDYNFDMLEEAVKSIDSGEYDYEGQMARTQLQTICRNSTDLIDMLNDEDNMPEWVQSKITLAQDYISTVRDYLQSKEELGEETLDEISSGLATSYLNKREPQHKPNLNSPETNNRDAKVAKGISSAGRRQHGFGPDKNAANKVTDRFAYRKNVGATHTFNKEEVELDERNKQNALMRKTMDASRGARFKVQNNLTGDAVRDWDGKHKTPQAQNKAIGRALRNEATTGNPGYGYHGQHKTEHDADAAYKTIHAHVKSLTDADDKTVKHYLDSAHGRHLVGHENDHEHIKKDFKKFSKYYKPEMHEATAQKGVNVDKVNHAGDTPHEEKWETAPKTVTKLKKVKEENMKSYKEFLQSLDEKLIGKQHKIDKNKNNKVDAEDFELLRKEEADHLLEYESDESGVYRHTKKATYGTSYNPKAGHEETPDDEKAEKMAAGRKTGQRTGSYKPRATMSKLKAAGSTYK
jgi:hypothetical protein